jgi:hypothetical protein
MKKPTLQEKQSERIYELEGVARVLGERILGLEARIRERDGAIGILNEELLSLYRRSDLAQIRGHMTPLSPLASRCLERLVNNLHSGQADAVEATRKMIRLPGGPPYGVITKPPKAKKGT